ncbi:hypothetical protein [Halobacillus sp. A5]|uniref:hypothetical protein n=1 Tax=Halobacillus sp. A5 TaxID=2880263 RepID=UPI0020A6909F|nr:hypothetical protein [Halobacillus sp. A5]MCP3025415.1 hypothetical protein [Halobacillus sp. A5]
MTLIELKAILDAAGYPVAYSHFTQTENNPVPDPPFITYLVDSSSNLFADNKVHQKINNVQIELYTDYKDLEAEEKLEDLLDENEIPYETLEEWIETEQMYQKIYETRMI